MQSVCFIKGKEHNTTSSSSSSSQEGGKHSLFKLAIRAGRRCAEALNRPSFPREPPGVSLYGRPAKKLRTRVTRPRLDSRPTLSKRTNTAPA